ncbi:uncharacterized protein LOC119977179 isoform X1 [Scyliorhinus canicula]|uniref:uncharacterized protein LOC119977179 isoform X1 n=2 Tax=Scyliorhinus canicula TaxID=7830 RepID=UPI0018F436DF|nr:uncharacterized protein LOC119977179 isoform X1 [Scyliorhinus canicula]
MHFYAQLWIFTLCLQAASALEVEDIQMPQTNFEVKEGDRLLIPCSFKTDEAVEFNNLRLEWGVITGPNNLYKPIYRVVGTVLEPITEPNPYEGRAQMFISLIPKGNCSLVLQSIVATDDGQYELKLYSDGEVTMNGQKISVVVTNGTGENSHWRKENAGKANAAVRKSALKHKAEDEDTQSCGDFSDFDKRLLTLTKGINSISTRTGVSTLGLEIIAGVVTGILLMGTLAGIVLCCNFYKGVKDMKKCKREQRRRRRRRRRSFHCPQTEEEQEVQNEEEVLQVETPDPTTSTSPLEQCGYQKVSDTNSSLYNFEMVNSD